MKALCVMSHTIPLGSGRFAAYEQGRIYDIEKPNGKYWEILPEGSAAGEPATVPEKKKSGKSRMKAYPADGPVAEGNTAIHLVRTNDEEGGNES